MNDIRAPRSVPIPVLLASLAVVWGTSFSLIKVADSAMSPGWISFGRSAIGAAVALVIAALRKEAAVRGLARWFQVFVLAFFANSLPFALFAWGELRVPSGLAGVLNATTPLFTLGLAALFLPEENLGLRHLFWMVAAFGGVVLILSPWTAVGGELVGELACLAAAASYGVAFVHTRRVVGRWGLGSASLSAAQLGAASLISLVLLPIWGTRIQIATVPLVALLLLGALNTGLAYLAYHVLTRRAGAARASTVTYLAPAVAVFIGVLFRGEHLSALALAGGVILLLGLAGTEGRLGLGALVPRKSA